MTEVVTELMTHVLFLLRYYSQQTFLKFWKNLIESVRKASCLIKCSLLSVAYHCTIHTIVPYVPPYHTYHCTIHTNVPYVPLYHTYNMYHCTIFTTVSCWRMKSSYSSPDFFSFILCVNLTKISMQKNAIIFFISIFPVHLADI